MRSLCAVALFAAPLACLTSPRDACHEQLLSEHGCCPFHGDECNVSREAVEKACGSAEGDHAVSLLDDEPDEDNKGEEPQDPSAPRPE